MVAAVAYAGSASAAACVWGFPEATGVLDAAAPPCPAAKPAAIAARFLAFIAAPMILGSVCAKLETAVWRTDAQGPGTLSMMMMPLTVCN